MRIDCPSCAAAYEVPAAVLTAPRVMRCARCGAEFMPQTPDATAPSSPAAARMPPAEWREPAAPPTPAPEISAPETPPTETPAPEISAPEISAPEISAPETSAPEMSSPETVLRADDRMGVSRAGPVVRHRAAAAGIAAAWLLSFTLLGLGSWAAIAFRGPVMQAWPPSARLYVALGYAARPAAAPD